MNVIEAMARKAREASRNLMNTSTQTRNQILLDIANELWKNRSEIISANGLDLSNGEKSGLTSAMLDRLNLDDKRIATMISDIKHVAELPDPVGEIIEESTLPNGLWLCKKRVPLGVIAVIYESRPNVTVDVAGLALKTGNCVILRGGTETTHTNTALVKIIKQALNTSPVPAEVIQFIDDPDRERVAEMLRLHDYIDMLIPRGGAGLHKFCREHSTIPVITGGIGICHLFVDESADLEASISVIQNAKVQRPSVCNALDTLLVHEKVAESFLPKVVSRLKQDGVTFRADVNAMKYLSNEKEVVFSAGEMDFDTEWLSLILGLKVVGSVEEAIGHIYLHSTHHSDGILTQNAANAESFITQVDSAAVYVNASTRFTDGSQFGLGAEVAISTQKMHARGPMGLRELTTYKWIVKGNYHVRP